MKLTLSYVTPEEKQVCEHTRNFNRKYLGESYLCCAKRIFYAEGNKAETEKEQKEADHEWKGNILLMEWKDLLVERTFFCAKTHLLSGRKHARNRDETEKHRKKTHTSRIHGWKGHISRMEWKDLLVERVFSCTKHISYA